MSQQPTPFDRFVDLAQEAAQAGDLEKIHNAYLALTLVDPSASRRAADRVFVIVVNRYPPFIADQDRLARWLTNDGTGWRTPISRALTGGGNFVGAVDAALADLQAEPQPA